jgi:chorismate synthase
MGNNEFGTLFKVITWGESHGQAIGAVIDGCPAGIVITSDEIDQALSLRAPGASPYTSPRKEADRVEILSGVFEGKTTGAPISLLIKNQDVDSSKYEPVKDLLRPGHANFTYLEKYGVFDYRGGGRASARETACRVAAGAVARKLLAHYGIEVVSWLQQVGPISAETTAQTYKAVESRIFCPDPQAEKAMVALLEETKKEGDSIGGVVAFLIKNAPVGLGDPVYEKLEAKLASAMMSLPASKGFEIGEGFGSCTMKGSQSNDLFYEKKGAIQTETNHSGGLLGGISNGMPIYGKVAFKPASSIMKSQSTLTLDRDKAEFKLPEGSRHDPCVAIRAVPVVQAMAALVIADALLLNRLAKL